MCLKCSRTAALCEKPSPSISKVNQIRDCFTCKSFCEIVWNSVREVDGPSHELTRWLIRFQKCILILPNLLSFLRESVRNRTPTA